jgi:hypothetical protein
MIPRRLADLGSRARVQINNPSKLARLSIRGGLVWFPTAHNLLTRPTPVVLEHDLFPSDHCFIGARALLLISLSEGGLMCLLTARIERAPSECARSASKKGTSGYHLCFPSSSFREGWTTLALLRASNEGLPRPRVARAKSRGCPAFSHPPCPTDLYICAVHIPRLIGKQITNRCHRIVDGADVPCRDAFGYAGQLFRRRTA